jgi:hypothetical protein
VLINALDQKRDALQAERHAIAREHDLEVQIRPNAILTLPIKDGQPITEEKFFELSDKEREDIKHRSEAIEEHIHKFLLRMRELEEETGWIATKFEKLTSIYTTPGFCDEELHIYLASGLKQSSEGRALRSFQGHQGHGLRFSYAHHPQRWGTLTRGAGAPGGGKRLPGPGHHGSCGHGFG